MKPKCTCGLEDEPGQHLSECPVYHWTELDEAKAKINRMEAELERLRIKCGPDEMIEGDYATLLQLEASNEALLDEIRNLKLNFEAWADVAPSKDRARAFQEAARHLVSFLEAKPIPITEHVRFKGGVKTYEHDGFLYHVDTTITRLRELPDNKVESTYVGYVPIEAREVHRLKKPDGT